VVVSGRRGTAAGSLAAARDPQTDALPVAWIRFDAAVTRPVAFAQLSGQHFAGSLPWRAFRWRRGQRHYSGVYWSATMRGHVVYESRLELAWLLMADRDRTVEQIYAQPFLLTATVAGTVRRHVPDFLTLGPDGVRVIDVKPAARLADAKVAEALGWAGALVRERGFGFEVFTEPDPRMLANVRFLAGYRRGGLFDPVVCEAVRAVAGQPVSIRAVESALAGRWPVWRVRPHVLHLLWSGRLQTDLAAVLDGTSLVRWVG
jgi:hypothetical protein